jgi:amino acid transporter
MCKTHLRLVERCTCRVNDCTRTIFLSKSWHTITINTFLSLLLTFSFLGLSVNWDDSDGSFIALVAIGTVVTLQSYLFECYSRWKIVFKRHRKSFVRQYHLHEWLFLCSQVFAVYILVAGIIAIVNHLYIQSSIFAFCSYAPGALLTLAVFIIEYPMLNSKMGDRDSIAMSNVHEV